MRAGASEAYSFEARIKTLIAQALGAQTFREDDGTETEFVTVSYWPSIEAMAAFAGADPTHVHHRGRDAEVLIALPERVQNPAAAQEPPRSRTLADRLVTTSSRGACSRSAQP